MWKKIKHLEWALVRLQDDLDVQRADFSNSLRAIEPTFFPKPRHEEGLMELSEKEEKRLYTFLTECRFGTCDVSETKTR